MNGPKTKCISCLLVLFLLAACGCVAPRTASPPGADDVLVQDARLLYQMGRSEEARAKLGMVLSRSHDERLKKYASAWLERIKQGLPPEPGDPHAPNYLPAKAS